MKRSFAIVLTMMMSTQLPPPTMAQEGLLQEAESSDAEALLPPRVDHSGVRATLLHWGMSRDDVDRILGAPSQVNSFSSAGRDMHVLQYAAEPIATTVTITDNKLSA